MARSMASTCGITQKAITNQTHTRIVYKHVHTNSYLENLLGTEDGEVVGIFPIVDPRPPPPSWVFGVSVLM